MRHDALVRAIEKAEKGMKCDICGLAYDPLSFGSLAWGWHFNRVLCGACYEKCTRNEERIRNESRSRRDQYESAYADGVE